MRVHGRLAVHWVQEMNVYRNSSTGLLRLITLCARGNELFLHACTQILEAEVKVDFDNFQRSHSPT